MVTDLRKEIKRLEPRKLICGVCDKRMKKFSRVSADGEDDWVRLSEFWYCDECCDLELLAEMTDDGGDEQ